MAQVASVDYPNKRIYLHSDTVIQGVDFIELYRELRALRRTNLEHRKFRPLCAGAGNIAKGGGTFTPRYTLFFEGVRWVPYDVSHSLVMLTEPVSVEGLSGRLTADRSPLSSGVEVDIDVGYSQVEVIQVASGSAVLPSDVTAIAAASANQVWEQLLSAHNTDETFGGEFGRIQVIDSFVTQMRDMMAELYALRGLGADPVSVAIGARDGDGQRTGTVTVGDLVQDVTDTVSEDGSETATVARRADP